MLTMGEIERLVSVDTLAYIKESLKLKKYKPTQKIQFLQILSKLDSFEAAVILNYLGYKPVALMIIDMYLTGLCIINNQIQYADHQGMECYLPYNERRDFIIKKLMKEYEKQTLECD